MAKAKATVHGAVSLVNAIANKKGATLGIELKVIVTIETIPVFMLIPLNQELISVPLSHSSIKDPDFETQLSGFLGKPEVNFLYFKQVTSIGWSFSQQHMEQIT